VARVYVREGSGKVTVNGRGLNEYFTQGVHVNVVRSPLAVVAADDKFDVIINVYGGGINGQAGACRHGLARALCKADESNYASLRNSGFLTRDSRMVERKKYGRPGARRRFQFSKR
jgi:small subunit ribosomal protein S9